MTNLSKPISRKSGTPANHYGRDAERPLVITLLPGSLGRDIIELRPSGTRRAEQILVSDLWAFALRCKAGRAWSEKMALKKANIAAKRAAAEQRKETRRLARAVAKD